MKQVRYTIHDPNGLHARPAGLLVQLACGEKKADLKRLFAVMGMGVKCGDTVELTVDGADEDQAVQALEAFLREHF